MTDDGSQSSAVSPQVDVLDWLLAGDPSVRWQVIGDLLGEGEQSALERPRVASDGWGSRLLAEQADDGTCGGGLYSPKWTSTTYTLLLLQRLGLPATNPQAMRGCCKLWDGASYFDGGLTLAKTIRQPETCITAMLVLLASSFGFQDSRVEAAVN